MLKAELIKTAKKVKIGGVPVKLTGKETIKDLTAILEKADKKIVEPDPKKQFKGEH